MDNLVMTTMTKEELKQLIADAVTSNLKHDETAKGSEELLNTKQLTDKLQVSEITLYKWRREGKLPFHRINRNIYYKWNEVVSVLEGMEKYEI